MTSVSASVTPALEVTDLTQGYGRRAVLQSLTWSVSDRAVTALVGPNGAGKSTLLRTLTTVVPPRHGTLTFHGLAVTRRNLASVRRQIAYLPQGWTCDGRLTVSELIDYTLWTREVSRTERDTSVVEAIERVGLEDDAATQVRRLSGGMRQRAGIAAAIAGEPPLIVLDEPTAGLDPEQRAAFRQTIGGLTSSAIIVSTHLIEDVASVAQSMLLLRDGEPVYAGATSVLTSEGSGVESLEDRYRALLHPQAA